MFASSDESEFADLLIEWGLLSRQELEEAVRIHANASRNGTVLPAFTETLVKYGFLTPRQVAEARSADSKGIFYCAACAVGFEVRISASRRNYQCPRCQDPLTRTVGRAAPVATAFVSDTVPVDVQVAMHNPETRFGKYVLLAEVGRGGAAVIRKGWDTEERCYVALKFLRSTDGAEVDPTRVEELMREGERAVHLQHPNIIRVYELGRIAGQYYIAMEYLEGFTLAELIKSAGGRSKVSPFYEDPARYLTMVRDVARAVHYAHTRTPPLIHCDLKPANIFVELSWRPYVLDFGVAEELNPAASKSESGTLKGSPAYMAPEQVLAQPEEIDVRTDVYGLGAILYHLLTGRPPFAGEIQEVLDKNLLMVAVPTPSEVLRLRSEISGGTARVYRVPPEVEAICLKCLGKEKKARYQSAREVADALTQVIKARPVTQASKPDTHRIEVTEPLPAPPPPIEPAVVRARWRRVVTVLCVLAALMGAAALVYRVMQPRPVEESPTERLKKEMDARAALLQLEAAAAGYRDFQEKQTDAATQAWVQERLDDLEAMREMRSALEAYLTRAMPGVLVLKLLGGTIRDAKILRASELGIELVAEGQRQSVAWSQIHPEQVIALGTLDGSMPPRARLGLASFAVKNRLWVPAAQLCVKLHGSTVDALARVLEKQIPIPKD